MSKRVLTFQNLNRRTFLGLGAMGVVNTLMQPFRLAAAAASLSLPSAVPPTPLRPPSAFTILVSMADPHIEKLLQIALTQYGGLQVVTAPTTLDAYAWCRKQPISLVLSDVFKAGLSGDKLLHMLRADTVTCHVPFMFYTAFHDAEYIHQAFALGADAYLTIPSHIRVLLAVIAYLLPVDQTWSTAEDTRTHSELPYVLVVSDKAPTGPKFVETTVAEISLRSYKRRMQ